MGRNLPPEDYRAGACPRPCCFLLARDRPPGPPLLSSFPPPRERPQRRFSVPGGPRGPGRRGRGPPCSLVSLQEEDFRSRSSLLPEESFAIFFLIPCSQLAP